MNKIYFVVFKGTESNSIDAYSFIDAQTFIDENIEDKCVYSKAVEDKIYSKEEVEVFMSEYRKAQS